MTYRPKGKHVRISEFNPRGLGICDYTGFVFNRQDLVKQLEWRGNALVWTGYLVGRPYVDKPNEQLRPPILPPDPVPFVMPRTMQLQVMTHADNPLPIISNIQYTHDSLWNNEDGTQALPFDQAFQSLQNVQWGF